MKALIVGGDSRLGTALDKYLAELVIPAASTTRRRIPYTPAVVTSSNCYEWLPLDLREPEIPQAYRDWTIFVVAAITGIVRCERDPDAWLVNADGPAAIARQCPYRTIFVSSDAVEIAPHTAYAKQKAYAELAVLAAHGLVLRPSAIAPEKYPDVATALVDLALHAPAGTLRRWRG